VSVDPQVLARAAQTVSAGAGRGYRGRALAYLTDRLNQSLERRLPERRLFIRSDSGTRLIRLRPLTQVAAIGGFAVFLSWTVVVTAILMIDSIGSGTLREQAKREQQFYEARLNMVSAQRDMRAEEAAKAQERFARAIERVSEMQSALLAVEERRHELETAIDVLHASLRRAIAERDHARGDLREALAVINGENGNGRSDAARAADLEAAMQFLTVALDRTADERDMMATAALQYRQQAEHVALERQLIEDRTNLILARLEQAVQVSMEPLERMFRAAGLPPDQILAQVRSGYVREEDRLRPLAISTKGDAGEVDATEQRVNDILGGLDRVNMYRIAAQRLPFARPVGHNVRFTSGFGNRRDPKTGRSRMHSGVDFAGAAGTAIVATSDGVVIHAGWRGGYGNTVIIQHDFGIETLYAHLSRIDVRQGQRVSRGDRIGGMGSTGRSTGVHLHYEVRVGGNAVNPMTYIRAGENVF